MSADLSIHRVTKVEIGEIQRNDNPDYRRTYDVRTIVIHHDGGKTEVTLFSEDIQDDDNSPLSVIL